MFNNMMFCMFVIMILYINAKVKENKLQVLMDDSRWLPFSVLACIFEPLQEFIHHALEQIMDFKQELFLNL